MATIDTGKKPILITGSHRSGTTWVEMISSSSSVGYIMEPFNLKCRRPGIIDARFDNWFQYVNDDNGLYYYESIKRMLEFRFNYSAGVSKARTVKDGARLLRDIINTTRYRINNLRPVVKEPTALFLSPWFAKTFDANIVILIRHPAAFVSSLMILNWRFPYEHFLSQKALMSDYLEPFENEINDFKKNTPDVIDDAILLWKIVHSTISKYKKTYENWMFLKHEDLSRNVLSEFEQLFSRLNIKFDKKVEKKLLSYSSSKNPADMTEISSKLQSVKSIKRDSKSNILNWKKRLNTSEILYIREKVRDISDEFYSDEEW